MPWSKNRWPSMQQKRKRWQQPPPPPAYNFPSASPSAVFPLTSKPKCYWHKTPSARCSISSTSAPFGSTSFLQTGAAINRPAAAFTCPSLAVTTSTPCSGKPMTRQSASGVQSAPPATYRKATATALSALNWQRPHCLARLLDPLEKKPHRNSLHRGNRPTRTHPRRCRTQRQPRRDRQRRRSLHPPTPPLRRSPARKPRSLRLRPRSAQGNAHLGPCKKSQRHRSDAGFLAVFVKKLLSVTTTTA